MRLARVFTILYCCYIVACILGSLFTITKQLATQSANVASQTAALSIGGRVAMALTTGMWNNVVEEQVHISALQKLQLVPKALMQLPGLDLAKLAGSLVVWCLPRLM